MDVDEFVDDVVDGAEERGALGRVRSAAEAAALEEQDVSVEAAGNLLRKAARQLENGDHDRAWSLVRRAAALPFDAARDLQPAAMVSAELMLLGSVLGDLERRDAGDRDWLVSVEALLGDEDALAGDALPAVRKILQILQSDAFEVPAAERRRLGSMIATLDARSAAAPEPSGPDGLARRLLAVTRLTVEHRRLSETTREPEPR